VPAAEPARFELRIEPMGWCVQASTDQPVLASARAGGVELPSSCRNGTCRACICRLVSGEVMYRIEWPGLSAEEKREGWILPCVAHPRSDVTVDAPKASSVRRADR
jgi:ferredoxin